MNRVVMSRALVLRLAIFFLACILMFALVGSVAAAGGWAPVGAVGFSGGEADYTSLALHGSTPYIAFSDFSRSKKATVMTFDGTDWQTVGSPGISIGEADFTSLALDGSGTPYVAFSDLGNYNRVNVMKYNGTSWQDVWGNNVSAGGAFMVSLALYDGTPYVAYEDAHNSYQLTVMKYNGGWASVGSPGFGSQPDALAFAIDNTGTPYVAFLDSNNSDKVTVMKYSGGNWDVVGAAGFTFGGSQALALALDSSRVPYVAFDDGTVSSRVSVMKYNGTSWGYVGTAGFSAGSPQFLSLQIDSGGAVYAGYADNAYAGNASAMKYDGANWVGLGNPGFSAGIAYAPSLALNGSLPFLAYGDGGNSNKATVMLCDVTPPVVTSFAAAVLSQSLNIPITVFTATDNYAVGGYLITTSVTPPSAGDAGWSSSAPSVYTVAHGGDYTLYPWAKDTAENVSNVYSSPANVTVIASPNATTNAATSVTYDSATLNGTVNANGVEATVTFEYGLTSSYGTTVAATPGTLTGTTDTAVSASITGLTRSWTYHYRVDAVNSLGTTYGSDMTFTTPGIWVNVGNAGFTQGTASQTSLAMYNNTPYVAFNDGWYAGSLSVVKYNGTGWEYVGDPGFGWYPSQSAIAIAPDGTPYVAYTSDPQFNILSVMKLVGTNWVNVGSANFEDQAQNISFAIDPSGVPYVSYVDGIQGVIPVVQKFDGGNWNTIGNLYPNPAASTALAIDSSGTPYLAFPNIAPASVFKFDGANWVNAGCGQCTGAQANDISLAIDSANTPFFAYQRNQDHKTSVMKQTGSNWSWVGQQSFSPGAANSISLAIAGTTPYVAFVDAAHGSGATVMTFNGTNWQFVGNAGFSAGAAQSTSLAFDSSGVPYVAYSDGANGSKLTVMKYVNTPTAVLLAQFNAVQVEQNVRVKWQTGTELKLIGFNVWRQIAPKNGAAKATWKKLNAALIAAKNIGGVNGANYAFTDKQVKPGKTYRYKLELVLTDGASEWSEVQRVQIR